MRTLEDSETQFAEAGPRQPRHHLFFASPFAKGPDHAIANEVHAKVTKVLVQSLGVEEDDVIPSATLQGDLGAESIDFLDIMFRWSVNSGSRSRGELFRTSISPEIVRDGQVTDEGLTALRSHALRQFQGSGARPSVEPDR